MCNKKQLVFASSLFLHRNCALRAIPFSLWWFSYSNTAIMKPLNRTLLKKTIKCKCMYMYLAVHTYFRIITSNHFSIRNLNVSSSNRSQAIFIVHIKCMPGCRGSNEVHLDQHLTIQLSLVLVQQWQVCSEYLIYKITH